MDKKIRYRSLQEMQNSPEHKELERLVRQGVKEGVIDVFPPLPEERRLKMIDTNKLVLTPDEMQQAIIAHPELTMGEAVSRETVKNVVREEILECERKWREITEDPAGGLTWDGALLDLPAILKALEEG